MAAFGIAMVGVVALGIAPFLARRWDGVDASVLVVFTLLAIMASCSMAEHG